MILAATQEGSLAIEDRYCNQLVPRRVQSLLRKVGCARHYIGGDKSWNISALIHKPNQGRTDPIVLQPAASLWYPAPPNPSLRNPQPYRKPLWNFDFVFVDRLKMVLRRSESLVECVLVRCGEGVWRRCERFEHEKRIVLRLIQTQWMTSFEAAHASSAVSNSCRFLSSICGDNSDGSRSFPGAFEANLDSSQLSLSRT